MENVFEERFRALNPEQQKAVQTLDGPVLVVAGPGSGKTELLSLRTANILRETDTLPSSILCLTFTDSAAVNMQKRLETLIGAEAYKVAIHTFHSFGREIIAQHPEYFYKGAAYSPADDITQIKILQEIFVSLPHSNSLGSYHPEHGYTYIKDVKSRISDLKKGGLSPEDFRSVLESNRNFLMFADPLISQVFEGRIDKTVFEKIGGLLTQLETFQSQVGTKHTTQSLQARIVDSLRLAIQDAMSSDKPSTKPITKWKETFTKKNDQKQTVLKDLERLQKNLDLAFIYEQYLQKLTEHGLFDYDDMLLDVVHVLQQKDDLRFTLQEKYLYLLVDEFQDTNGVQMRLLDLLMDSELNEGRPNIMAVGDDDQSIYKFQGANVENILGFHQKFRDPAVIVLTRNYRSTQQILDFARKVILQGEDRLENRLEGLIQKELLASREDLPAGLLTEQVFETSFEELFWVATEIQKKIQEKTCKPSEIALLAPVHAILEQAAKVLNFFGIPVAYERKQNLLEERHIREIITILQFIDSVQKNDIVQRDDLLPQILSFEFWGLNRIALWRLAYGASKSRINWLEAMLRSESQYLRKMANFLINLAAEAKEKTAEEIIDLITGVEASVLQQDENDDDQDQSALNFEEKEQFRSPFKKYYFNETARSDTKSNYYEHLENMRAFVAKIREYNAGKPLMVHDAVEFIQLLKSNNLPLNHTLNFSTNDDAVQLMTVYKAKGLEFDSVYVLHCQDDTWLRRRGEKLQFPTNLPLSPENQTPDDALRLFYVAVTRAKHHLYLTRHRFDDKGKEQIHLRFLTSGTTEDSSEEKPKRSREVIDIAEVKTRFAKEHGAEKLFELEDDVRRHHVYSDDEKHLLKNILQNYRLSVTHLTNFLNVAEAGPHVFLEQNLLRFPQMMNPSAAFGSAMHGALANFYSEFKISKQLPSLDFLKQQFVQELGMQRLNKIVYGQKLEKGMHDLGIFYEKRKSFFDPKDKVEVNFAYQQVVMNGANLSGKIDLIHVDETTKELTVIDYKTGKLFNTWEPTDNSLRLKAWKYKLQLVFYKLLIEHSREYRGRFTVKHGVLEFLEPKNGEITLLDLEILPLEVQQLQKLIGIVFQKIMNLDFPDISSYDRDLFGVGCFIDDLLNGRV